MDYVLAIMFSPWSIRDERTLFPADHVQHMPLKDPRDLIDDETIDCRGELRIASHKLNLRSLVS